MYFVERGEAPRNATQLAAFDSFEEACRDAYRRLTQTERLPRKPGEPEWSVSMSFQPPELLPGYYHYFGKGDLGCYFITHEYAREEYERWYRSLRSSDPATLIAYEQHYGHLPLFQKALESFKRRPHPSFDDGRLISKSLLRYISRALTSPK